MHTTQVSFPSTFSRAELLNGLSQVFHRFVGNINQNYKPWKVGIELAQTPSSSNAFTYTYNLYLFESDVPLRQNHETQFEYSQQRQRKSSLSSQSMESSEKTVLLQQKKGPLSSQSMCSLSGSYSTSDKLTRLQLDSDDSISHRTMTFAVFLFALLEGSSLSKSDFDNYDKDESSLNRLFNEMGTLNLPSSNLKYTFFLYTHYRSEIIEVGKECLSVASARGLQLTVDDTFFLIRHATFSCNGPIESLQDASLRVSKNNSRLNKGYVLFNASTKHLQSNTATNFDVDNPKWQLYKDKPVVEHKDLEASMNTETQLTKAAANLPSNPAIQKLKTFLSLEHQDARVLKSLPLQLEDDVSFAKRKTCIDGRYTFFQGLLANQDKALSEALYTKVEANTPLLDTQLSDFCYLIGIHVDVENEGSTLLPESLYISGTELLHDNVVVKNPSYLQPQLVNSTLESLDDDELACTHGNSEEVLPEELIDNYHKEVEMMKAGNVNSHGNPAESGVLVAKRTPKEVSPLTRRRQENFKEKDQLGQKSQEFMKDLYAHRLDNLFDTSSRRHSIGSVDELSTNTDVLHKNPRSRRYSSSGNTMISLPLNGNQAPLVPHPPASVDNTKDSGGGFKVTRKSSKTFEDLDSPSRSTDTFVIAKRLENHRIDVIATPQSSRKGLSVISESPDETTESDTSSYDYDTSTSPQNALFDSSSRISLHNNDEKERSVDKKELKSSHSVVAQDKKRSKGKKLTRRNSISMNKTEALVDRSKNELRRVASDTSFDAQNASGSQKGRKEKPAVLRENIRSLKKPQEHNFKEKLGILDHHSSESTRTVLPSIGVNGSNRHHNTDDSYSFLRTIKAKQDRR